MRINLRTKSRHHSKSGSRRSSARRLIGGAAFLKRGKAGQLRIGHQVTRGGIEAVAASKLLRGETQAR